MEINDSIILLTSYFSNLEKRHPSEEEIKVKNLAFENLENYPHFFTKDQTADLEELQKKSISIKQPEFFFRISILFLKNIKKTNILNQTDDLFDSASPLLLKTSTWSDRISIINILGKLPPEEREELIEKTLLTLDEDAIFNPLQINKFDGIGDLIKAIHETPKNDRDNVIGHARRLFDSSSCGYRMSCIIRTIKDIPQNERNDLIETASPLLFGITEEKDRILKQLYTTPKSQWKHYVERTISLLPPISSGHERSCILTVICNLPADQEGDIIKKATHVFNRYPALSGYARSDIINSIKEILPNERQDAIDDMHALFPNLPVLEDIDEEYPIAQALDTIQRIPKKDRSSKVKKAAPLVNNISSMLQAIILYQIIEKHSEYLDDQTKNATAILSLFSDRYISVDDVEDYIFKVLKSFEPKHIVDLIKYTLPDIPQNIDGENLAVLLNTVYLKNFKTRIA